MPKCQVRSSASAMPLGAGVAIEKIIENITAMAMGMPRLPHAIAKKATKVAGTSTRPRRMGAACSSCTRKNSGSPISGAGSIWKNLPRRGPGRSGGAVTITPTAAAEAATAPSHRCAPAEITSRPSATVRPLATYWLSAMRSAARKRRAAPGPCITWRKRRLRRSRRPQARRGARA